ncbi:MAG: adenylate/guanylate cyclase domain-containing protein [Deltaproteobacteria bacterium]|nr:adenylate/guanylate cyclase domain-containing protein [Deltaproteobacteria bacterium]
MSVRFPLRFKIGVFSVVLVAGACAAIGYFAVLRPALSERAEREEQYEQIRKMLGATGAVDARILTHQAMHPDLVYVARSRGGVPWADGSVAHVDRLAAVAPDLAQAWQAEPRATLEALFALDNGQRRGLVVKRVKLRSDSGDEVIDLGFSTLGLDRALRSRLAYAGGVFGAALLLAVLGALLLAGRIARPLQALAAGMDRAGKGALEPVTIVSRDEVGLLARAFNEMVRGLKERERLKNTLARYVSDDVAARILTERSDLDLKGEMREVTVLFLDIRGFTALSERLPPREVVAMLNEYFESIIEVVFKHHGTVNKVIGDAVMALFGAPFVVDDAPMRAVQAAVEIEQAVAAVNQRRQAEGKATVTIGAGINTGSAVAGNVGSERRMEYTVIGDEVNLAQRLEALAREGEILVSQATYDRVRERVQARAREPVQVKGKTIPVWVYEIVGLNA